MYELALNHWALKKENLNCNVENILSRIQKVIKRRNRGVISRWTQFVKQSPRFSGSFLRGKIYCFYRLFD